MRMSKIVDIAEAAPPFRRSHELTATAGWAQRDGKLRWRVAGRTRSASIPHRERENTPLQRGVFALRVMDAQIAVWREVIAKVWR